MVSPHCQLATATFGLTLSLSLGPPLAGDLGATVLRAERDLGIEPEYVRTFEDDFRPNPVDEAERARRMREAALQEEAARAPVFFQLQSQTGSERAGDAAPAYRDPALDVGSELLALAALPPGTPSAFGQAPDPNLQSRKLAFAGEGRGVGCLQSSPDRRSRLALSGHGRNTDPGKPYHRHQ